MNKIDKTEIQTFIDFLCTQIKGIEDFMENGDESKINTSAKEIALRKYKSIEIKEFLETLI